MNSTCMLFRRLSGVLRRSTDLVRPFLSTTINGDTSLISRLSLCLLSFIDLSRICTRIRSSCIMKLSSFSYSSTKTVTLVVNSLIQINRISYSYSVNCSRTGYFSGVSSRLTCREWSKHRLRSVFGGYAMHKKGDHLIACVVLVGAFR